jgi:hypothetical protein
LPNYHGDDGWSLYSVSCEEALSTYYLYLLVKRQAYSALLSSSSYTTKKVDGPVFVFPFFCLVHRAAGGRVIRSCDMSFCISPCFRVGTKRVEVPNERLGAGGGREHVFCWHGRVDPASSLPPARGRCSGCPARAAPSLVGHRRRDGIGNPRARDP